MDLKKEYINDLYIADKEKIINIFDRVITLSEERLPMDFLQGLQIIDNDEFYDHIYNSYIVNEQNINEIAMVNGQNHIGEIYTVSNDCKYPWENHKAENMGNLSKRVQKTPEQIKETAQRIHPKSLWLKTTVWGKPKEPKTYEYRNSEPHSNKKATPCVGSYHVSGYTRLDGVKVEDYIRRCGARHGT